MAISFRTFSIPLTMVVTFGLTVAIMGWNDRSSGDGPEVPSIVASAAPALPTEAQRPVPRMAAAPASRAEPTLADPLVPAPIAGQPVPVLIKLRPKKGDQPATEVIVNLASRALEVNLTAVNSVTHATKTARISLEPHARRSLDESGFVIEPGDVVNVHSPPYDDIVETRDTGP